MFKDASKLKDDSTAKRLHRCFEECLKDDLQKYRDSKYKLIQDLGAVHRNRIIKSVSHQILASVINISSLEEE